MIFTRATGNDETNPILPAGASAGKRGARGEEHTALLEDPWGKSACERFNSGLEGQQEVFSKIIQKGTVEGVN